MYGHPRIPRIYSRRRRLQHAGGEGAGLPLHRPFRTSRWGVSLLGLALLFGAALFLFGDAFAAPSPPCPDHVAETAVVFIAIVCAASGYLLGYLIGRAPFDCPESIHGPRP